MKIKVTPEDAVRIGGNMSCDILTDVLALYRESMSLSQLERGVLRATPGVLLDIAIALKCNVMDIADADDIRFFFDLATKLEKTGIVAPQPIGDALGFLEEIDKRCRTLNRAGLCRVLDYLDDITQIPGYLDDYEPSGDQAEEA